MTKEQVEALRAARSPWRGQGTSGLIVKYDGTGFAVCAAGGDFLTYTSDITLVGELIQLEALHYGAVRELMGGRPHAELMADWSMKRDRLLQRQRWTDLTLDDLNLRDVQL